MPREKKLAFWSFEYEVQLILPRLGDYADRGITIITRTSIYSISLTFFLPFFVLRRNAREIFRCSIVVNNFKFKRA